jgi:hypothetical protein
MALGEFGIHPAQYVNTGTYDDPRFIAMALDSLNLETSEITAMNDDVARSLTCPRRTVALGADSKFAPSWWGIEGDNSNFFIGISLSQVGFQAGTVSSPNTNIPFIFDATLGQGNSVLKNPDTKERQDSLKLDTSIICMFLIDAAIMIHLSPTQIFQS